MIVNTMERIIKKRNEFLGDGNANNTVKKGS